MYEQITVKVPSPGYGISAFPITGLCRKGNIATPGSFDFFKMDLSGLRFICISQVVAIAQLHLWANMLHADVTMDGMPSDPEQYASRMNLFKIVGIKHGEEFSRHASDDRFIPLNRITPYTDINTVASTLTSMVTRRIAIDSSVREGIDYAFGEVMDNVIQHSGSPIGGITAAQYYPNMGYLELCVSDCGCGIAETMSTNSMFHGMSKSDLMLKAFEQGCGERTGAQFLGLDGAGMGMGLTIAKRLVRTTHGTLWAVSQGQAVCITDGGIKRSDSYWFPGTIMVMRIPTDNGVVIRNCDIYPDGDLGKFSWSVSGEDEDSGYTEEWLW